MITKACKKILIIICIMSIILPISSEVLAAITNTAKGTTQNFGISLMHTSKTLNNTNNINFGYRISTKNSYRINAGGDYSQTILCLDKEGKFPQEEGASGTYKSQGEATAATLNSANSNIDATKAQKIQWLIKNALLPEDSIGLREQKLSKIFNSLMEETSQTENPLTLAQIKNILTEDDVVFALQSTLWQLTNNTALNALQGTTDDGATWDGLEGNDKWGYKGKKGAYIRQIINYYNTQLSGNLAEDTAPKTNPTFNTGVSATTTISGRYVYIGPFNINKATNYYSIEVSFKNSAGKALSNVSYCLTDKASNTNVKVLPQTKEGLEGKNFYVRLASTTAARKVEFNLNTQIVTQKAEGTVWTNENVDNQPLLSIKRTEIPGTTIPYEYNFDIIIEKQYDASLRKYITAIKRTTTMGGVRIIPVEDRTPAYGLLPSTGEEPFNQYEYRHKKNPLEVQVGDKIVYTIRVTNECEHDMIIKTITDYLPPSGIEYVSKDDLYSNENNKWQYTSDRKAVTTKESGWYLEPRQYAEVKIVCEVTTAAKGRIITNIAEITQIADENNKTVIDIDSEPKNVQLPKTEEEWENYKGNEGTTPDKKTEPRYENKDDLTDSNYYYKGQQDDDDFEKITVKMSDGEYDLQIVKGDKDDNIARLQGAKFNVTLPNGSTNNLTTNSSGIAQTGKITISGKGTDTIKIIETEAPTGYAKIGSGIELAVTKDIVNGQYKATKVALVGTTNGESITISGNTIIITIMNEKLTGQYDLQIVKTDKDDDNIKLAGAKFEITLPDGSKGQATTPADGTIKTNKINITGTGKDTITVKELEAPEDYNKIIDTLEIEATKEIRNGAYAIKEVSIKNNPAGTQATLNGNTIVLNIKNEKIKNAYDLALKKFITKVEKANGTAKQLPEAQKRFIEVTNVDALIRRKGQETADATYRLNKTPVEIVDGDYVTYTIRVFNEGKTDAIVKEIRDTLPKGLEFVPYETNADGTYKSGSRTNYTYKWKTPANNEIRTNYTNNTTLPGFDITKQSGENKELGISYIDVKIECKVNIAKLQSAEQQEIYKNGIKNIAEITDDDGDDNDSTPDNNKPEEDDQDYDIIIPQVYDLALKKFITTLTTADGTNKTIPEEQKRFIEVTNVDRLVNRNGNEKVDAIYKLNKTPVSVVNGDYVTYTIRVFNEGKVDAIVKELVDTVPEGLEFVPYETNADGTYKSGSRTNYTYKWETFNKTQETAGWTKGIRTNYLNETTISAFDKTKKSGTNKELGLSYTDVKVEFKVNTSNLSTESKENIFKNGIKNIAEITDDDGDDNDSTPDDKEPEEDDEDYDIIIPKVYDLALKKFITGLTTEDGINKIIPEEQKRFIEVTNVDALTNRNGNAKADAIYKLNKTPVNVSDKDYITYTIRVFNEGDQDAIVKEIIDTVPEGLEFVPYETNADGTYKSGSKTNYTYKWQTFEKTGEQEGWAKGIRTNYLNETTISAFDKTKQSGENKELGLSYTDVKVEFKVNISNLENETKENILKNGIKNIAEITDDDGDDNDSTPDDKEPEEDDEDYDIVIPLQFDLALRKFITKIDNKDVTDRVPEVIFKDGKIKYEHTKEPKVVVQNQIVTYTIRVYNEGSQNGYATEITDDLPEGIEFLPNHETNQKYQWKMYDEEGKETTDVSKAKKIKTNYLSREKGTENLLTAFDPEKDISEKNPSYKEVKATFKVVQDSATAGKKIITNTAQISEDEDEYGNPVDDIDSIPGNDEENEDDIDKEHLILKYFDLSLLKYVSKVIVTEDGVTKETETGYDGTENPEPVVKVELNKKKLDKTDVKYVYSIKITNEGEIEGYATEITDRIPDGLAFYEEDNTEYKWKTKEAGIVTTDYLKDTLLKPGESAVLPIVLRWERNETNLGQKVNVAEISKDKNEFGAPDIDSTPNNNKDGEDDQDNAIVVLTLKTGSAPIYITLIITTMVILSSGFYLIYKHVVK